MNKREERFLRVVSSLEEVPIPFQNALKGIEKQEETTRIIIIPKQEYPLLRTFLNIQLPFGWRIVPQRMLVFSEDTLDIFALNPSGGVDKERIDFSQIFSVGIGSHLLYAYVDISWFIARALKTVRIEFNAVGEGIMRERLDQIRARISDLRSGVMIDDEKVTDFLQDKNVPIKFRNYATFSLIPGEKIVQLFYQPAIRGNHLFGPPLSPNRLFTLTDRHLIVFDEDYSVASNYSIITHFYPLHLLIKLRLSAGDGTDEIHFHFNKDGVETELTFPLQKERVPSIQDSLLAIPVPG